MEIDPPEMADAPTTDARIAWLEARVRELETALARASGAPDATDDATAARWSATGYPFLERGQGVGVGHDLPPDDFLATGWWPAEDWGVWGRDAQHSLRFHIPDHAHGYVSVRLTLRAFVAPGHERPQVSITANGYFMGHFHLSATAQTLALKLPPSAIDQGDVILHLEHSDPRSPASIGIGADIRPLGVGFVALFLP